MKSKVSLAFPIIALLILISLSTLLIGYYINLHSLNDSLESREIDKTSYVHFIINSIITEEIEKLTTISKLLKETQELTTSMIFYESFGDSESLKRLMGRLFSQMKVNIFDAVNTKGTLIYCGGNLVEENEYRHIWGIDEALEGKDVLAVAKDPRGWGIRAFVPIRSAQKLYGVIIVGFMIDDQFAQKIAAATSSHVSLATARGVFASSLTPGKKNSIDIEAIKKSLWERNPITINDRANTNISRYAPLMVVDETFCLIAQSDTRAVHGLLNENKKNLFLISMAVLSVVILVAVVLTLYLIKPLKKLKKNALQIVKKYSGKEMEALTGGNEIQALGRAHHLMLETIHNHLAELNRAEEGLRHSQEVLEARIRERTEDLVKAKDEAQAANRAKSEFLANMSHELRTPLNHIIGFTELVVDKQFGDLNEVQGEYLNDALQSSRHLLSLINDILDLSKVEAGKLELEVAEIHLRMLLEGSLSMVQEKAMKHRIRLLSDINGIPEAIQADERRLKQILYNLLSNAVKFTPDGGSVTLSARYLTFRDGQWFTRDEQPVGLPLDRDDQLMRGEGLIDISVQDTGIGIKGEDLQRIFAPFEQVESSSSRRFAGTGLGLSLTKRLVELHGGRIWAESEGQGKGSKFSFVIISDGTETP